MDNENSKKKTGGKRGLYLVVALLAVALVAGVVLLVLNREKGEPEDPTIEKIVTQSGEIIEVYNPCVDDELKEKPLSCFTDTNYSLDFLGRFRSSPERCWVAVDGYAYDVTPGEDGYEYPGPGEPSITSVGKTPLSVSQQTVLPHRSGSTSKDQ